MAHWLMALAVAVAFAGDGDPVKKDNNPVDQVQAKVCAVLANLDSLPADKKKAEEVLRQELYRIVDTDLVKLRPPKGAATLVSKDRRFVLVIGANGAIGANGQSVEAKDGKALIVMAVAGDGGPGQNKNIQSGFGGAAATQAKNGIAIALGGRGAPGS
jgi:hypothetical protein